MVDPVIITNRPFWARALIFLCVIELAMGLLFIYAGFTEGSGLATGLGVLIVALFAGLAAFAWPIARLRQPAIEMGPEGLLDRRFASSPIPWDALRWKVLFNGRSYSVAFDVAEPHRQTLALSPVNRLAATANRFLHRPEFTLHALGTGLSAHQLSEKLKYFKAPAT